ncbi:MAG TPA: DUF444 family protein [Pseudomonadales bacterium]|nr:DUF444 family protein [Pseudomonadales bacterium]
MSIFKRHNASADRSAPDRRRHKKKIEKAIREGVYNIISEESIIGQDGKKKIRIPVRGIKEYRFVYGDNQSNRRVGSAPGVDGLQRGQQISKDKTKVDNNKVGSEPGEEYYDIEITLEELAAYLFDNLELPDLEKKKMKKVVAEKFKRHGYRNDGIRPRLDKKETIKKRARRRSAAIRTGNYDPDSTDRFPFHNNDLRYRHIKQDIKHASNAVVVFIMDVSGSMTRDKKFLARSFFFLLYQFIRHRYENTELVFIAHDTSAYEVNEEQFFSRGASGGTKVSSGIEMALNVVEKRFHPSSWNIYTFHCSDGDNWFDDIERTVELTGRLRDMCQLYGYCEIETDKINLKMRRGKDSSLASAYKHLQSSSFKIAEIFCKEDIWPAFKRFFGGKLGV